METLCLGILPSENSLGCQKGEGNQKVMSLTGRKRFSDITNITSRGRSERSESNEQEIPDVKNSVAMLLKENNALMRLVDERNKILEITGMELQKFKISLQKANQQNWQLAQTNSHMLAELNLGKDRLKVTQHELGCAMALLRAKTRELQEEKKLNKQFKKLKEKIGTEESGLKPIDVAVDPSHHSNSKKPFNINGKRTQRSRSLGPTTTATHQETAKEKDEGHRKFSRRACNVKAETTEYLFEIEDLKLPLRSDEDGHFGPTSSADNEVTRDELHKEQRFSHNQNQGSRRSSIGRPLRKAAEKVSSYKEVPVNVKMRRAE